MLTPTVDRLIKRCKKNKIFDELEVELTLASNIALQIDQSDEPSAHLSQQLRLLIAQIRRDADKAGKDKDKDDLDEFLNDLRGDG